ncbi:of fatty acids protein 1 [Seminavis robusta]|uniref:Elongation of fatty acids protein n=1 Tax=Seminavis robusta TaxID=568900 RepID=A0A9N8DC29_9STRA|nr:of fatty acids protein 1 [Seminavis robusta]|eukprot:Sro54_g031900.1 of fatty acids protein 1 (297) ;mRNA; f:73068-73958
MAGTTDLSFASVFRPWRPEFKESTDGQPLATDLLQLFSPLPDERLPENPYVAFFVRRDVLVGLILFYVASLYLFAGVRDATGFSAKESPTFRNFVAVHNLSLAIFSAVSLYNTLSIVVENMIMGPDGWVAMGCDTEGVHWNSGLGGWAFIYFLSKLLEFVDTWILVLKGKQPSFLQVFHHIGMVLINWGVIRARSSWMYFPASLNLFIHSLMYTYFFIKTLYPNAEIKQAKYLTMAQIGQFVLGITVSLLWASKLPTLCISQASAFVLILLQTYTAILVAMFASFAHHRYKLHKKA